MQSQDTELTNESLRNVRTILFVDVVEFVRLSEEDEEDAVAYDVDVEEELGLLDVQENDENEV